MNQNRMLGMWIRKSLKMQRHVRRTDGTAERQDWDYDHTEVATPDGPKTPDLGYNKLYVLNHVM